MRKGKEKMLLEQQPGHRDHRMPQQLSMEVVQGQKLLLQEGSMIPRQVPRDNQRRMSPGGNNPPHRCMLVPPPWSQPYNLFLCRRRGDWPITRWRCCG